MDLPCREWHEHVEQKWNQLPTDQRKAFCTLSEMDDVFAFGLSVFNHTDVEVLSGLSDGVRVQKTAQSAGRFREQGNLRFKARDYTAAALYYSKGVCHAGQGKEELSLCFANRSAALFHLCLFQECLQDIRRALDEGYPSHLQQKLLDRRAQCLNHLGQQAQGKEACVHSAMKSESCASRAVTCASPAVALRFSPRKGRHLVAVEDIAAGEVVLEERAFACVLIPGGAPVARPERGKGGGGGGGRDKEKEEEEEEGKGAFSTEDQHCHNCLRQTLSAVPCQGCSYARYCGERCQREAWAGHHRWECPVGAELRAAGVVAHLALRVALRAGLEEVQRAREEDGAGPASSVLEPVEGSGNGFQKEGDVDDLGDELSSALEVSRRGAGTGGDPGPRAGAPIHGCDPSGCYLGGSYLCVHHLLPHLSGHEPGLRFLCAVTVAALCLRLREEGPLPAAWEGGTRTSDGHSGQSQSQEGGEGWSPELRILGATALRHMLQLRCNAQAVTTLKDTGFPGSAVQSVQEVRIATAIFPTLSLLNHSCSPNTSLAFRADPVSDGAEARPVSLPGAAGVTVTVLAAQPVGAGQELLHCYGPHYSRMPVSERQRLLQEQYFFLCQCSACCQELRSKGEGRGAAAASGFRCERCQSALQRGEGDYLCSQSSCGFQLSQADLAHRLQELQGHLDQADWLIERDRPDEALRGLQTASAQASRFLPETHPVRGELADASARAFATMGDWHQAAAQLRCSVAAVRSQYGEESVELARQLFKLAQLHFNGGEPQPALAVIPKARRLLSLHCPGCDELEELQAMEDCLQGAL
ncbi:hypothetical protein AAFF_G00175410 [Aldrovandia affinis]|uniref:Protein-lysine N-methyltransferase SMYD4 n=1 Tax=Aldrovandia affinis TaxID=143900 RepID=A0AAD7RKZ3_9TELE|nr:hypothetical protein AAFF_G00175410 [Aldrovandia affinis]